MIDELRAQRAGIFEQMRALHEAAEAESRDLTADEQAQWDKSAADMDALKARIERAQAVHDEQAALLASTGVSAGRPTPEEQQPTKRNQTINELIRAAAGRG